MAYPPFFLLQVMTGIAMNLFRSSFTIAQRALSYQPPWFCCISMPGYQSVRMSFYMFRCKSWPGEQSACSVVILLIFRKLEAIHSTAIIRSNSVANRVPGYNSISTY